MNADPRGLLLIAAFAAFPAAVGCSPPTPPASNVVRPVKTMVVTAGDDTQIRSFPGKVEASRRVELAFQVPGVPAIGTIVTLTKKVRPCRLDGQPID